MKKFKFADDVDVVIWGDKFGDTPLHYLARTGKIEVLKHKSVATVKNIYGNTPLHELARTGKIEVLKHKSVDIVKNNLGKTPLRFLALYLYNRHLRDKEIT